MDGPFYRRCRSHPYNYHSLHTSPVQKKKVVSIPVQYVVSEQSRSDQAVKIQKVFRGYLVRKSVKKILGIKRDIDEVEESLKENVQSIREDSKERLRVMETLMNLLLQLDGVRGVDCGVRECRRKVIKKAIALQETVDAIVNECCRTDEDQTVDKSGDVVVVEEVSKDCELGADGNQGSVDTVDGIVEAEDKRSDEVVEECGENALKLQTAEECDENEGNVEAEDKKGVEEGVKCGEEGEESVGTSEVQADLCANRREEKEASVEKRGLLERMVEENEKMMGLMAELLARNEEQTRLLSSLSHRVELLERAFVCDKLRRKKRNPSAPHSCGGFNK
ncbi:hypothetical protein K2173_005799 [Erythroxylum novogranatense]|uniref:BAG domain-containing protein n=1 Tax=Erythroxylum novogranatense TaxID=1862640 RepID=A0AAV8U6R9_9ROSI|nr:hypothetical protein K2173_005799 [Erythroxylum novogranatense]